MKKCLLFFVPIILFFLAVQVDAQNQNQSIEKEVDYPWVPRFSAYEAYLKYKAGKAIIFHGGGAKYSRRHILGAFNLDLKDRDIYLLLLNERKWWCRSGRRNDKNGVYQR